MEKGEKKNIIVVKSLIILLFLILLFLIYLSVRNIYNNATFYLNGEKHIGSFTEKEFNKMISVVK